MLFKTFILGKTSIWYLLKYSRLIGTKQRHNFTDILALQSFTKCNQIQIFISFNI